MDDQLVAKNQNSSLRLRDWRESLKALMKLGVDIHFKNSNNIGLDLADLIASLGFGDAKTPESLAWLLINRALLRAMLDITETYCEEWQELTPEISQMLKSHLLEGMALEDGEFAIDHQFFHDPQSFPGLANAQRWMEEWLMPLVQSATDAKAMSDRLPSYFVVAVHHELLEKPSEYQRLTTQFADTLAVGAYQRELGWRRYTAWLDQQLDEPIFAESFGIRPLYVPLRAYYFERKEVEGDRYTKSADTEQTAPEIRHAQDLEAGMDRWLQNSEDERIRLISGGPGSGKSTFTKWWAAKVVQRGVFKVLHVPLNHLNFTGDLENKLKDFAASSYLTENPLREPKILIVFDGLDELAFQGKAGLNAAEKFVEQAILIVNASRQNLRVLISGRDVIIQSQMNKFSKPQQIWYLLPYYLPPEEAGKYQESPKGLLEIDQRDNWWINYSQEKDQGYSKLPDSLNLPQLTEITAQPILNYLLAISPYFLENQIDQETTRNQIYQSLLEQVHQRDWAPTNNATKNSRHPNTQDISFADFQLVLEEVGLCTWHGDGRKATEGEIIAHCKKSDRKVENLLLKFSERMDNPEQTRVTRLLTAFYFQERGERSKTGDKAFEFTHKSFGEFLTAKRLVRAIAEIDKNLRVEDGWRKEKALKKWVEIYRSGKLDFDILEFLRQEVRCQYHNHPQLVRDWQETCGDLISYLLQEGLPMEQLQCGLTFREMNNWAIQAEIGILAMLNACSFCTKEISKINWPDDSAFGNWLARLSYIGTVSLASRCLGFLNLEWATLKGANLEGANLEGATLRAATLEGANLYMANLGWANLEGANLGWANLHMTNLEEANLHRAKLYRATLRGATLRGATLEGAILEGANLEGAYLRAANLRGANLRGANLEGANWEGADLERATLPKRFT
jgi:uncharacterized protein YjbI with pentapeptide repeats